MSEKKVALRLRLGLSHKIHTALDLIQQPAKNEHVAAASCGGIWRVLDGIFQQQLLPPAKENGPQSSPWDVTRKWWQRFGEKLPP